MHRLLLHRIGFGIRDAQHGIVPGRQRCDGDWYGGPGDLVCTVQKHDTRANICQPAAARTVRSCFSELPRHNRGAGVAYSTYHLDLFVVRTASSRGTVVHPNVFIVCHLSSET